MSCGFSRVSLTKYFVDHPAEQRLKLFRRRQKPPVELVTQNRRIRYIERPALEHFLSTRFGDGNFAVEMKEDQWVIKIPKGETITDASQTN
ncbi:hypothetical protein G6514_001688 [Epicoccum nigrum]|nr:hypothetical protein G6514_001688 [Epicoccum nigrum]